MENKANSIIVIDKDELKREAVTQGKQVLNCTMQETKNAAMKLADRFIQQVFDSLIDWVNAKLSA